MTHHVMEDRYASAACPDTFVRAFPFCDLAAHVCLCWWLLRIVFRRRRAATRCRCSARSWRGFFLGTTAWDHRFLRA